MGEQLNEQLNRIKKVMSSIINEDFQMSNIGEEKVDLNSYNEVTKIIDNIHCVGSEDGDPIISMDISTFIPDEDQNNTGDKIIVKAITVWETYTKTSNNNISNIYKLVSLKNLEPEVPVHEKYLNLMRTYFVDGNDVNEFMNKLYRGYLIKSSELGNDSYENVVNTERENKEELINVIKNSNN
jgi:hypothetical protein